MFRELWREWGRFSAAGVINSLVSYGAIFILMSLGTRAEPANVMGYIANFVVAYFLNKHWVFAVQGKVKRSFLSYVVVCIAAYIANFLVLLLLMHYYKMNAYGAQLLSGFAYTVVFYLLNKYIVFR